MDNTLRQFNLEVYIFINKINLHGKNIYKLCHFTSSHVLLISHFVCFSVHILDTERLDWQSNACKYTEIPHR